MCSFFAQVMEVAAVPAAQEAVVPPTLVAVSIKYNAVVIKKLNLNL